MKKPRTLGLTILIIFAVLTSCTSNPTDVTPTQAPADTTPSQAPTDVTPSQAPADITPSQAPADTTPTQAPTAMATVNLHVEYATDELLAQFDAYDEYEGTGDEYDKKIIITTDTALSDLKYVTVILDAESEGLDFVAEEMLYTQDEFLPDRPLVVAFQQPGSLSSRGIAFVDENGAERLFIINEGGLDPAEGNPFSITE